MKTKLRKAFALLLVLSMLTSLLAVGVYAAPGDDAGSPGTEQGGDSGGEQGGGAPPPGGSSEPVDLTGMLALKQYVFVASEDEIKNGAVSTTIYGIYEEGETVAFEPTAFNGRISVYADSELTEEAGVTAAVSGSTLTLSGVATKGNVAYYLTTGEDAYTTIIYVVNDEYNENTATLTLADGSTVDLSTYAPNMANGDYTAVVGENEINGETAVYIGANRTAVSLSDLTDKANYAGYEDAVAWYLQSGITNAGDSLTTFGDKLYGYEYAVGLYRLFQIVVDQITAAKGYQDPADFVGAMGSNDPYSDAVSATLQAGVWNGIYTKMTDVKSEGDNGFWLTTNISKDVTTLGTGAVVDAEFAYVGLYNAFQSAWSSLNADGEEMARSLETAAAIATAKGYKDAYATGTWNWAAAEIGKSTAAGIFEGDNNGIFNADKPLRRSEMAKILWAMAGRPEVTTTTNPFTDLKADWYKDPIEWCYANGIVKGRSATTFAPDAPVTREEMSLMLMRFCDAQGIELTGSDDLSAFPDKGSVHPWALSAMQWAVGNGLIRGSGGKLLSQATTTRAMAAAIMSRLVDRAALAPYDYSNTAKITAVSSALLGEKAVPAADKTLTKAEAVNVLYACRDYVASKTAPDQTLAEKTGSAWADMSQFFTKEYDANPVVVSNGIRILTARNNLISTEGSALMVKDGGAATVINSTISLTGNADKAVNTICALEDPNRAVDGAEAMMPDHVGMVYNATTRNAFYRVGLGSALTIWGGDVKLTSTNGSLVLDGEATGAGASTMAGTAYVSYGGSLQVKNGVAYSSGQHLTNNLYNGTIHYIDSAAISSGRVYSSDFWGGYQVFEDTIADGGSVTDEPTTLIVKNSVYGNSVGGNGFAAQYFENSIMNVSTAKFQNTTSLVTDTGSLTVVNSVLNNSSDTLAASDKGERAIITLVDSTVNLNGSSLASVGNYKSVNNISTQTVTTDIDEYNALYNGEMAIYFYGDVELNLSVTDKLKVCVAEGAKVTIYSANLTEEDFEVESYTLVKMKGMSNEIDQIIDCGKGELVVVNDPSYGTVTVNRPLHVTGVTYTENYVETHDGEDWFNSPSASSNIASVTLSDGTVVEAEDGGVLTLVVNGDQYDILDYLEKRTSLEDVEYSFETTAGTDEHTEMAKFMNMGGQTAQYTFRAALTVDADGIVENETIPALLTKADASASGIQDGELNSYGAFFNSIIVKDVPFTVSNMKLTSIGDGANDFNGQAAVVYARGTADVTVEDTFINTSGVIRTATAVNDKAIMRIKNSVIYTQETEDTQAEYDALVVPMMKRTPFALGLEGVVRATNVLGAGRGIYDESLIVSTGWGVLSTDSGVAGTEALRVTNTAAGNGTLEVAKEGVKYAETKEVGGVTYGYIPGGSGYVAYADAGVEDYFDNVRFYGGNEVQIMASSTSSAYYTNSVLNSGHIGVMTQQNNGGLISIVKSTLNVGETGIQIKSGSNAGYTNVLLDETKVKFTNKDAVWGGTLVELVESDDAGNPGVTEYTINDVGDKATNDDVAQVVDDSNATLANGTYDGNIWNNVYTNYEALNVTLDAATVNGTISSSYSYHVNDDGTRMANGTVLYADTTGNYLKSGVSDYNKIGAQYNVANKQVNNPVNLTLTNGSTWNVVLANGTNGEASACYIHDLTVEAGCTITSDKPVTIYVHGTKTVEGTIGENVTIVEEFIETPDFTSSTITFADYHSPAYTVTFEMVDEEGNPVAGAVKGKNQSNPEGIYYTLTAISGYEIKDADYSDPNIAEHETGDFNGYEEFLSLNGDATVKVVVAPKPQGGPGGGGGGDMGGDPPPPAD